MSTILYTRGRIGYILDEEMIEGKTGPADPETLFSQYGWAIPVKAFSSSRFENWISGRKRIFQLPDGETRNASCSWIVVDHYGNLSKIRINYDPNDRFVVQADLPTGNTIWTYSTGEADQDILVGIASVIDDPETITKLCRENNVDLGRTMRWTTVEEIVARLNKDFPLNTTK